MNERYRQIAGRDPQNKPHPDAFWTNKYGWMEHDTTLQAIADAWNTKPPKGHDPEYHRGLIRQEIPELGDLLDVLTQEDTR